MTSESGSLVDAIMALSLCASRDAASKYEGIKTLLLSSPPLHPSQTGGPETIECRLGYEGWFQLADGRKHGVFERVNEQGAVVERHHYRYGQLHGAVEEWNDQGARVALRHFRDNKLHGTDERWHYNGERHSLAEWHEGKQHGVHLHWDSEGSLIYSAVYVHGKLHGPRAWLSDRHCRVEVYVHDNRVHQYGTADSIALNT